MSTFDFDLTYSAITGAHLPGIYVPRAEHDEEHDVLLDMHPRALAPGGWRAVVGKTGQYSYRGAVMHPSETATDEIIREWVRDAGGDVFAVVIVEAPCTEDEPCFPDEPSHCQEYGCDAEPAGWAVIYQMED